ncbi:cupin domain-containing protein [Viscerimonas tarda]
MNNTKSKTFFVASEEKIYPAGEGITRQFVGYDANIMMVKVIFEKGAVGAPHTHPHVQTTYVVSGKFEAVIAGETKIIEAGDGFYAAPNALHGCTCLEAGILLDVFNPVREDFLKTIE